ncbi:MAG: hypothetical protein AAGB46_10090 [Verrucomicrobiota bacterium]
MNSKRIQFIGILAAALLLGWATRGLEQSASEDFGQSSDTEKLEALTQARLSQGMSLALLGGYRPIVANMVWIAMDGAWMRRDFDTTLSHIKLATSIDPRHEFFWLNGARIIANDMPTWRYSYEEMDRLHTTIEGRMIKDEFAEEALELLEKGSSRLPENPLILAEMGVIEWRKKDNLQRAGDLFLKAWGMPDAPYYVGRIYAEVLERQGRREEALAFLREMVIDLPENELEAMVPVVRERIRRLERALGK